MIVHACPCMVGTCSFFPVYYNIAMSNSQPRSLLKILSSDYDSHFPQVAYSSSAIILSDRQRFVNFFRTYPSDENLAPALLSFLQFYGWNRIMFITQEQNLFTGVSRMF